MEEDIGRNLETFSSYETSSLIIRLFTPPLRKARYSG